MTDQSIVTECVQRFDRTGPRAEITPTGECVFRWLVRCYDSPMSKDWWTTIWWTTITHRGAVRTALRWVRRMDVPPEVIEP